ARENLQEAQGRKRRIHETESRSIEETKKLNKNLLCSSLRVQDNLQQQSNGETEAHDQQTLEKQRDTEKQGRGIRFRLDQFYHRQRMKQQQSQAQQPQQDMKFQQQEEIIQLQQQTSPQKHQSLASHFHLFPLVEKLAEAIETGRRDQNSNALVTELNSQFNKSQQLLNSISGNIGSKSMTVDGQKRKLEDNEKLLQQRRELMVEYRKTIEAILKIEP
ncbi:unnamed protein product, partial [Thlaspi arvense]